MYCIKQNKCLKMVCSDCWSSVVKTGNVLTQKAMANACIIVYHISITQQPYYNLHQFGSLLKVFVTGHSEVLTVLAMWANHWKSKVAVSSFRWGYKRSVLIFSGPTPNPILHSHGKPFQKKRAQAIKPFWHSSPMNSEKCKWMSCVFKDNIKITIIFVFQLIKPRK